MIPSQKCALEAVKGATLTQQEIDKITPLLDPDNRNDAAIATILSAGRTRPVDTDIGIGTILAKLGANGGAWLDSIEAVGQQDSNVKWAMALIRDGRFRIDMPESRAAMQALAVAVPALADGINVLLTSSVTPDPIAPARITQALDGAIYNVERV